MQRGDMFVYPMNGKPRPVLVLGPSPAKGGLLVVGISSKDFGIMSLRVSGYGLERTSWITPQINVFYSEGWRRPLQPFGTLPEEVVKQVEQTLLEYIFGHLL